jgi:hypothetical protein
MSLAAADAASSDQSLASNCSATNDLFVMLNATTSANASLKNITSSVMPNASGINASAIGANCSSKVINVTNSTERAAYIDALATRAASLSFWRASDSRSDTLGPPSLSVAPTIAFLTLRITATSGDAALPAFPSYSIYSPGPGGVYGSWSEQVPGGPAEWAAQEAGPPELSVYVEAPAADPDSTAFISSMAGPIVPPANPIRTDGGAALSPTRLLGSQAGAGRAFAVAQVRQRQFSPTAIHARACYRTVADIHYACATHRTTAGTQRIRSPRVGFKIPGQVSPTSVRLQGAPVRSSFRSHECNRPMPDSPEHVSGCKFNVRRCCCIWVSR